MGYKLYKTFPTFIHYLDIEIKASSEHPPLGTFIMLDAT